MNTVTRGVFIRHPVEIVLYPTFGVYEQAGSRWSFCRQRPDEADDLLRDFRSLRYDPWDVRDDFMSSSAFGSWDSFVAVYGRFGNGSFDLSGSQCREDFASWRDFVKLLSATKVTKWNELQSQFRDKMRILTLPLQIHIEYAKGRAKGVLIFRTVIEAIIASVRIDKLNRRGVRYCLRQDCLQRFKVENGHERFYCKPVCAHVERNRRYRARLLKEDRLGRASGKINA